MSTTTLLSDLLDPVSDCLDAESARRLIAFRPSQDTQERVASLAQRANEGVLTDDEHHEYEAVVNAMDIVAILKLKARSRLVKTASAR